jgi:hypothetical protein
MQRMDAKVAATRPKPAMLDSPIAGHDTNKLCNSPTMDKTEPVLQLYGTHIGCLIDIVNVGTCQKCRSTLMLT